MKSILGYRKLFFSIIRQYTSSKQQTVSTRESIRSFFVRLINDQRRRVQQDDIRLEPTRSKGIYTETGAIRPIPKRYPLGFVKVLSTAIIFIYLGCCTVAYIAPIVEKIDMMNIFKRDDDDD